MEENVLNQARCGGPYLTIPSLERVKQEGCKFETSLGCMENLSPD
jgi:hypothetical protein